MKQNLQSLIYSFLQTISKVNIAGEMMQIILDDFQANTPDAVRKNWAQHTKRLFTKSESDMVDESRFLYAMALGISSHDDDKNNFKQIMLQQEFVSYFAHVEAIFQDIQRLVYYEKPEYLPNAKEVSWKEILEYRDFQSILKHVIEEKLYRSGYLKITDLIISLNSLPFQFKISIKKDLQSDLEEFILIRNMIIHNGSKVSADYEAFTGGKFRRNEPFFLNSQIVNQLHDLLKIIVVETFAAIQNVLFEIPKIESYDSMAYIQNKVLENYKKQKLKRN